MYLIFNVLLLIEFLTIKSISISFLLFMFFFTLNNYYAFKEYTDDELKELDKDIKKIGYNKFYSLYIIDLLERFLSNCSFTLIIILVLIFTGALK